MSRKGELYAIVADLHAMRYSNADIGRALGCTAERIRQIVADLGLTPPRLRSAADLPPDLRERVDLLQSAS